MVSHCFSCSLSSFRPHYRLWFASVPYRIHSLFLNVDTIVGLFLSGPSLPRKAECLPRCIRSRRMTLRHAYICRSGRARRRHMLFSIPGLSALFFLFISSPFSPFLSSSVWLRGVGSSCPIRPARGPIGVCSIHGDNQTVMGRSGTPG